MNLFQVTKKQSSGGESKSIFTSFGLNSGKIKIIDGTIVEDSSFYYTDRMPLSNGDLTFDLGFTSSQTYSGLAMYDDNDNFVTYWNCNSRYRNVNNSPYYAQGARWFRLSFPVDKLNYAFAHDWVNNKVYCADEPAWISNISDTYENISNFDNYFHRNSSTPVVNHISNDEVSISYQDQSASGYEGASFSISLSAGLYVAEIYATLSNNTGLNTNYAWGIYSTTNSTNAQDFQNGITLDTSTYNTYTPFNRSDTAEHYYEVPIKMLSAGTAYLCFATPADNGTNTSITVRSLKIRKADVKVISGSGGSATLITKSITANGDYAAFDDDADGYSSVHVAVPTSAVLITKSITANGTYYASSASADGYSSVTVNVPLITPSTNFKISDINCTMEITRL